MWKEEEFRREYAKAYSGDSKEMSKIEKAWQVYSMATKNLNGFCLMGRIEDRKTIIGEKISNKNGILFLHNDKFCNFEITNLTQPGNVLLVDDNDWSLGVNDAWVLGGIHSKTEFCLFSSVPFDGKDINTFLDHLLKVEKKSYLSVTGRELLGLINAQYETVAVNGMLGFKPPAVDTSNYKFGDYLTFIDNKPKGKAENAVVAFFQSRIFN